MWSGGVAGPLAIHGCRSKGCAPAGGDGPHLFGGHDHAMEDLEKLPIEIIACARFKLKNRMQEVAPERKHLREPHLHTEAKIR